MKNSPLPSVADYAVPGGWCERALLLGDHHVRILLPAKPDAFLEQLEQPLADEQEADPYWAELWPVSLTMARLVQKLHWPRGTRAIELGCGIGAVGLAGLLAGLDVTFTDRVELAVSTAVENAQRNGFANAYGFALDWARPPEHLRYPIILASDVLYDRELHAPLLRTIEFMLADGGECWIGDPGRSSTEKFLEQAQATGLTLRVLDEAGREATCLKLGEFRLVVLLNPTNSLVE